jgi:hypothetical protein
MNDVEFEGENSNTQNRRILYSRFQASNVEPKIVSFLISKKIVKTEAQANLVLIGIVAIFIVVSIVAFRSAFAPQVSVTSEEVMKRLFP